jgi:protease IV
MSLNGPIIDLPQSTPDIPFDWLLSRFISLPSGPQSVHWLRMTFERLSRDARVKGVVLRLNCEASAAVYQALRAEIETFRATGRKVVAYAEQFGPFQYYLACGCDQIVMPPSADWSITGFASEYLFFKDVLERIGVGVDVVNVSPFKSAGDQFARNDFSDESRAQAEWLLGERFDELVRGVALGRRLSEARVRELIDGAPYSAAEAVSHGLIDAALYEDQLERFLEPTPPQTPPVKQPALLTALDRYAPKLGQRLRTAVGQNTDDEPSSPTWTTLGRALNTLLIPIHDWHEKSIGVVRIEGMIIRGNSRKPPPIPLPIPIFGDGDVAGSTSVSQALRRAEKDKDIAAVILYVDSQGGDALASDLMARDVQRLRQRKPVVVYMSGVAASGGYYVSAPGQHIIAQPMTITGSIGVIIVKPHVTGLYEKIGLGRTLLSRGENAGVFADSGPLNPQGRDVLARGIARVYGDFKTIVSSGRSLPNDERLEAICGGRVWTGRQALEHKLVDELGGFPRAMTKAIELANINLAGKRVGWTVIEPGRGYTLPGAFDPGAWLAWVETLRQQLAGTRVWLLSMWGAGRSR